MIKRGWQEFLIEITEGQRKGFLVSLLRAGLTVLSGVYYILIEIRLLLYRCRLLKKKKLSSYTISVGNITVGGTGKTPAVAMLAEELQKRKCRVAVLSRGYGREVNCSSGKRTTSALKEISVVSDGKKLLMEVREAGDEPYLLAKNLPGVAVLVGKDRKLTGNYALNNLTVNTLILDDGYQYWPLIRDLDIVVIDSLNPFGNGHLLPRGKLREPLKNLRRGGLFLLTRVDQADNLNSLREKLRKIKPGVKIVETIHHPDHLIDFKTGERQELGLLSGKRVLVLSSLGHPQSFERTLSKLGALLVEKVRFPDHHRYREAELREVEEKALKKGVDFIITTEKDAVRIASRERASVEMLYLTIKLRIIKGKESLEELLPC